MAVNNDFKYTGLSGNTFYVSAFHGDDLNPGTAVSPFRTKAKAELTGANGDNIILGSGFYEEEQSLSSNSYKYFGEGRVIINQPAGAIRPAIDPSTERVENIIFTGWISVPIFQHSIDRDGDFINCQFIEGKIQAGIDLSFGYYIGCIFDTIEFEETAGTDPTPTAGGIFNCVFRECTGNLPPLQDYADGVFNNHFVESDTLMIGIAGGQPIAKFDFNNVEGGLNGLADNAAIQALGFNTNGSAFLSTDIFNDFDILRSTTDYFKQDYTQKTTSPVLLTSKSKGPVTRFNEGDRFDAAFLEGSNDDIDSINLVGDQLQVVGDVGFIINSFNLGSIKNINLINILQDIQFNSVSGQSEVIADFLEDMPADDKATYDIQIKHKKLIGDSFTTTVVEYDKYILDRTPQVIEARFLQINLTLRDYTI